MTTAVIVVLAIAVGIASALWARERATARKLRRQIGRRGNAHEPTRAADAPSEAFFDLVTHELRSPLSAIIGYQELLSDAVYGEIGDAAREPVARIGRSAQHLLHLMDGIIDLAQLRAKTVSTDIQDVDLDALAASAAADFCAAADERHLRRSVHVEAGLPHIRSDLDRLARAIHLLCIAAVKNPAGDRLELRIETHGHGVAVRIRGTRFIVHADHDQPPYEGGIRVAVAAATARLLGGDLFTDPPEGGSDHQITFLIRDVEAAPPL